MGCIIGTIPPSALRWRAHVSTSPKHLVCAQAVFTHQISIGALAGTLGAAGNCPSAPRRLNSTFTSPSPRLPEMGGGVSKVTNRGSTSCSVEHRALGTSPKHTIIAAGRTLCTGSSQEATAAELGSVSDPWVFRLRPTRAAAPWPHEHVGSRSRGVNRVPARRRDPSHGPIWRSRSGAWSLGGWKAGARPRRRRAT
jgi:hypothetical protein